MRTTATVIGVSKKRVFVRVPALHEHRILKQPREAFAAGIEKGDEIEVEVQSEIEHTGSGWAAALWQVERTEA